MQTPLHPMGLLLIKINICFPIHFRSNANAKQGPALSFGSKNNFHPVFDRLIEFTLGSSEEKEEKPRFNSCRKPVLSTHSSGIGGKFELPIVAQVAKPAESQAAKPADPGNSNGLRDFLLPIPAPVF
jgi:hypothetical protein